MICRLILADWVTDKTLKRVVEGDLNEEEIKRWNSLGYNCYYLPNHPKRYDKRSILDGSQIDSWNFVFVDFDLKDKNYESKEEFLSILGMFELLPTRIVDSGHGLHVYWRVKDLDSISYLHFQKRLIRYFKTDESVWTLFQLMRIPGTINIKNKNAPIPCEILAENPDTEYTCEVFNSYLPTITLEDKNACKEHYDQVFNKTEIQIEEKLPLKFAQLLERSAQAKSLFLLNSEDRSSADFNLCLLLKQNDFTKEEALSVLVNTAKALSRNPAQRVSYAQTTVDKIWKEDTDLDLSSSVEDILKNPGKEVLGARLYCDKMIDNTARGFRHGQVLGLIAGSGVGKTSFALNLFRWSCLLNPALNHFFISLEMSSSEVAERWNVMCQGNQTLNGKVHIIDNHNKDGTFRHLSLKELETYIKKWKSKTGKKVGCIVIDHIGVLKQKPGPEGLIDVCKEMKVFARETDSFLIMQSQASREKAGEGDLELGKDAAYGTVFFESYCDYIVTLWQPLKKMHFDPGCPTVTSFKFCKIRFKNSKRDLIQEDVPYHLFFDSDTEQYRQLTQKESEVFNLYATQATALRSRDKKQIIEEYNPAVGGIDGFSNNRQSSQH